MCKRILCLMLCVVMIFSFSVISFAEDDRIPEAGDHIFLGHYEQDNDLKNGPEPIEWRILEVKGDKILLLSEYILDALPFNEDGGGNIWGSCTLRDWLNNDFMEMALSEEERTAVCLTEVDNGVKMYGYGSRFGSKNTEDRVFLLSYREGYSYFKGTHTLDFLRKQACAATAYAKPRISLEGDNPSYKGLSIDFMEENCSPWWFRTAANSWHCALTAAYCKFSDEPYYVSHNYIDVTSCCGIRPAMWISLSRWRELNPVQEPEDQIPELETIEGDSSVEANTVLGDTTWKLWLPKNFEADELTEADLAENYIGYYLRGDDIIAVQYSDSSDSLAAWQKELRERDFTIEGLYLINGAEAVIYRDENADTITASILDGKGKLLEVTFYPYSTYSEEADLVISSIQQEASKKRLSGASGTSKLVSGTSETPTAAKNTFTTQEEAYHEMVTAYKAGKYSDSYSYYEQAKGYQDADKYGNLLKARLCYTLKLTDSEIEELEKAIVNDISFADSKDVLVCNSAIAHYYLLGTWYSTNGTYIYEVKDNGGTTTTVPVVPRTGNYYEILNGTYWRYFDEKWDERTAVFDFKPISKSKMEIYSYQVKQSYTFNKTR